LNIIHFEHCAYNCLCTTSWLS